MMSSSDVGAGTDPSPIQNISAQYSNIQRQYQQILDRWTPHMLYRWLGTAGLLCVFFLRIILAQGVSSHWSLHIFFLVVFFSPNLDVVGLVTFLFILPRVWR